MNETVAGSPKISGIKQPDGPTKTMMMAHALVMFLSLFAITAPCVSGYLGTGITGHSGSRMGTRGQTLGALAPMILFYVLAPSGPGVILVHN